VPEGIFIRGGWRDIENRVKQNNESLKMFCDSNIRGKRWDTLVGAKLLGPQHRRRQRFGEGRKVIQTGEHSHPRQRGAKRKKEGRTSRTEQLKKKEQTTKLGGEIWWAGLACVLDKIFVGGGGERQQLQGFREKGQAKKTLQPFGEKHL